MKLIDINPVFADRYERMKDWAQVPSLWQEEAQRLVRYFETDFTDLDETIGKMLASKRLDMIFAAGLQNDIDFLDDYKNAPMIFWENFEEIPVERDLQDTIAERLYFSETPQAGAMALFNIGDGGPYIARKLVEKALQDGISFEVACELRGMANTNFGKLLIKHADTDGLKSLADYMVDVYARADKSITAIPQLPNEKHMPTHAENLSIFAKHARPIGDRLGSGELMFTLMLLPTRAEAKLEGIPYEAYCRLTVEMCDQPWEEIGAANQTLIDEYFNVAKKIRITHPNGTDLTGDLVDEMGRHFKFANSLIARNLPGSEFFAALRRDTLSGTYVAEGYFSPKDDGEIIKDLTLHFENGKVASFEAAEGAEIFQRFLDRDPNNAYCGEIGFGTNPHLRRHVLNGLLTEKEAVSVHLALGDTYPMTNYLGTPVHVDNGNHTKTGDHWDVAMSLADGGCIELDGQPVMKDGRYRDPRVVVLNEGWYAIPEEKRPPYWQEFCRKYPGGYEEVAKIQQGWSYDAAPE